ncbi:YdeI/OmpD-associated family protein [Actinokineospora auranticolor]|uniref:Uncharacterized protein YdeI (YjbR/CyaY-like superfamily) n=1 Tax=Actinokineospora auranticolor TaxID=155976 RepID=A0A2S6GSL4_9PSEU|nr:YdeI/OmpD-associated family protein [Actinokineospora auranticolor]PPK68167.1 uncharacterized protein YdeI (YjbR/CyaY-like superfamily) [Actinokineospora auranticolor]
MEPTFFAEPGALRAWFDANHATAAELWVGFRRKRTGLPSVSWSEAVDQALCFGWIDGVRKGVDDTAYMIRFTRRKTGSIWSSVNIAKVADLTARGLMLPEGLAAFEARRVDRSEVYSHEQAVVAFTDEQEAEFRAHPDAWAFFERQPPGYRKTATWRVISAKRDDTRRRRLATLIEASAAGLRIE